MMRGIIKRLAVLLMFSVILLAGNFTYAIPIDLTVEENEKLKEALNRCIDTIENDTNTKFMYFGNYEAHSEQGVFIVDAYLHTSTEGDEGEKSKVRYWHCTARLIKDEWHLEYKEKIFKTKEKGVFEPPSTEGYTFKEEGYEDMDRKKDKIKETRVEGGINPEGKIIFKLTTKEHTWAWGVKGNPSSKEDSINNYIIVDSDGDGVFDEKYPEYEFSDISLPEYLKSE